MARIDSSMRYPIRATLQEAGFGLVEFGAPRQLSPNFQPDVLAWASNSNGELVPWAVVEIKSGRSTIPDLALPALSRSRDLLGTTDHYAVVNGRWFKADRSVRYLEPVEGPAPPPYGTGGLVGDEGLATSLLLKRLWGGVDRERAKGDRGDSLPLLPAVNMLAESPVPVRDDVLWRARRNALVEFASGLGKGDTLASSPSIASAVVELAGPGPIGTVLDPFCGTGSFLWSAMDRTLELGHSAQFVGMELNPRLAEMAATIGETAPVPTIIRQDDAFSAELPDAQLVITAPPVGMRLPQPWRLMDGSSTADAVVAGVDLAVRHLSKGGRAVLHVGASFTFHAGAERFRQFLASEYFVSALIGLPSGAIPGTRMRSVLMVIDRKAPGDTFVCQLGEDWSTQLSVGGAVLTATLAHIGGADRAG